MPMRQRIAATAISAVLAGGALGLAPAAQAHDTASASCYGGANSYLKPAGTYWLPAGDVFSTSSACADINIKPNTNRYVKVCFETDGRLECQANYTLARAGQWNVIARNVRDGALFAFEFRSDAKSTGSWAA
ncbi:MULTISPECIES: hypothetical protein [unclassified Streptomyces]|uniref:hypothetical protein n=1 Tax=unclassified Streptomyces TaxID=2593676 RepID=UPI001056ED92|nr:hypothetical protein [Streptomyces sp. DH-12]